MPDVLLKTSAARKSLAELEQRDAFIERHIGPDGEEQEAMLKVLGYATRAALMDAVVPPGIRTKVALDLPESRTEAQALAELRQIAGKNRVFHSFIGQGYYNTHTPGVILRNILENPAWYTAYTPYQPEISQGRLEAMINFQTMVCDLTGMAIANASMLDEGTAAAEAMALCLRAGKAKSNLFYVADDVLPQTIDVIRTRAGPLGIEVKIGAANDVATTDCFGVLLQYPAANGEVNLQYAIAAEDSDRGPDGAALAGRRHVDLSQTSLGQLAMNDCLVNVDASAWVIPDQRKP